MVVDPECQRTRDDVSFYVVDFKYNYFFKTDKIFYWNLIVMGV